MPSQLSNFTPLGILVHVWDLVAHHWSVFWSTLRAKLILSMLGCQYGAGFRVDGKLIIRAPRKGAITIGNNVKINSRFLSNLVGLTGPTVFHCIKQGRISIGDNSGLSGAVLSSRSRILIGSNVKIGGNVRIYDHDYHALDYLVRRQPSNDYAQVKTMPVTIGDDVLIGANAIILKGVTIGPRSIIGAGSVVALKEIPPDSLVVGNPAKIVKRNKSEQTEANNLASQRR